MHARTHTYIRLAERCALGGGRWCRAADETRVVMPTRRCCRRSCCGVGQTVRRDFDGTRRPIGRPTATLVRRYQSARPLLAVAPPSKGRLGEKNPRVVDGPPLDPLGQRVAWPVLYGSGENAIGRRPTHVLRLRSFRPLVCRHKYYIECVNNLHMGLCRIPTSRVFHITQISVIINS